VFLDIRTEKSVFSVIPIYRQSAAVTIRQLGSLRMKPDYLDVQPLTFLQGTPADNSSYQAGALPIAQQIEKQLTLNNNLLGVVLVALGKPQIQYRRMDMLLHRPRSRFTLQPF
jgi:hypothetical protein